MSSFLVSPAEPPLIRAIGFTSQAPERHGFDVLWAEPTVGGLVGIQRKEFGDLINSVADGRLAKEVLQWGGSPTVKLAFLIIEGIPHWTMDGELVHRYAHWHIRQYRGLMRSAQQKGMIVETTKNMAETIERIGEVAQWCAKEHRSLVTRPKPGPDRWGQVSEKGWASHLLQSIPGLGPKQAEAIYDHFEGKVPIGLTCTAEELLAIKGLGPKKVDAILRAFNQTTKG